MKKLNEIIIRDPFILRNDIDKTYYLYKASEENGKLGFSCYKSKDLENFDGPFKVFEAPNDFWGTKDFWAPEVYFVDGFYYLLATYYSEKNNRGCQFLRARSPLGPFEPYGEILTPKNMMCLDASLFYENGKPYIIFCHEWLQCEIGEVYYRELSLDLSHPIGEPIFMYKATDAKWPTTTLSFTDKHACITDGTFVYEINGNKYIVWSSFIKEKEYGTGYVKLNRSILKGPYIHSKTNFPLKDAGHPMCFKDFEGNDLIIMHINNCKYGKEIAKIFFIKEEKGELKLYEK